MYTWVGYCAINALYMSFWGPYSLEEIRNRIEANLPWLKRFDPNMASYFCMFRSAIGQLLETAIARCDWARRAWPEAEQVMEGFRRNEDQIGLLVHATSQLSLANWFGETESAAAQAAAAETYALAGTGMLAGRRTSTSWGRSMMPPLLRDPVLTKVAACSRRSSRICPPPRRATCTFA